MRVLITGFGPFPGAPRNPTMGIVQHLGALKSPAFAGLTRLTRILPTTWDMLQTIPDLLADTRPDAVLMFGLAGRRRVITPELVARNRASVLRPDALRRTPKALLLTPGAPAFLRSTFDAVKLTAALKARSLPAKASRDAGDYLCNALLWHVLAAGISAIFIHVPRPQKAMPKARIKKSRPSMAELERAGEVVLREVMRQARIPAPRR
jgi:pyroglutamyl-peptidase